MKFQKSIILVFLIVIFGCGKNNEMDKVKGFRVSEETSNEANASNRNGIAAKNAAQKTKSVELLATTNPDIKLIPIYLVNYSEKEKMHFTGSNDFHYNYEEEVSEYPKGTTWEYIVPGFQALYGYNLVNVFHFDQLKKEGKKMFENPVLIKTCYFPTTSKDSINFKPVIRNYFMISVYDEDTNKDKFIDFKDLRRFYFFDEKGQNKEPIVPINYSVTGAFYDVSNDYLYIDAKEDQNKDGKTAINDPVTLFYLDLKNPKNKGIVYKN